MKYIKSITSGISLAALAVIFGSVESANAFSYTIQDGVNAARGTGMPGDLFGAGGVITNITNVLLFVVGALAVIMIIVGGIRYATSGGNATSVTSAKNTILYAIVGLVIAFLAFAAVNWILSAVTPGGASGGTNV